MVWRVLMRVLIPTMFCVSLLSVIMTHFLDLTYISLHRINSRWENANQTAHHQRNHLYSRPVKSFNGRISSKAHIGEDIINEIIASIPTFDGTIVISNEKAEKLCPFSSPLLVGWTDVSLVASDSRKEKESTFTSRMSIAGLKPGGKYKPRNCHSRNNVAVIVPYRYRGFHLKIFLRHMHPFLQRQQLQYVVFLVEQSNGSPFNRGMLLNIGFKEAMKQGSFQCFIFHDVDLLPEDDRNPYTCPKNGKPRQMAYSIDIYDYRPTPKEHLGGVSAFTVTDFQLINGFSNSFWGWGSEDDDLYRRSLHHNLTVTRITDDLPSFKNIVRYRMIDHRKEKSNPERDLLLDGWRYRLMSDGLTTLSYKTIYVKLTPLFTHILVDIQQAS
ncbi:beta-1,4-galactosyltransferase 4-like [Daphnia carinata]|uniref:beta-1,4-galactosyltransferase 4-like n=1 Tax=Daphnia carinata TaxID=120202 RepID=UPI002579BFDB|nr:beta-1,4-galactosyltransferase 4-like [Daphnia carinata]